MKFFFLFFFMNNKDFPLGEGSVEDHFGSVPIKDMQTPPLSFDHYQIIEFD